MTLTEALQARLNKAQEHVRLHGTKEQFAEMCELEMSFGAAHSDLYRIRVVEAALLLEGEVTLIMEAQK